jgi:ATP-dependent exoDNAse (exonuclease V) beta subunit
VRAENKFKDRFERTRLIYIAMTRAKRSVSLYATFEQKSASDEALRPRSESLLNPIWDALDGTVEARILQAAAVETTAQTSVIPDSPTLITRRKTPPTISVVKASLLAQQLEVLPNDDQQDTAPERQRLKALGTLSHAFLEAYSAQPFPPEAALSALEARWISKLCRMGATEAQSSALVRRSRDELLDCLGGEHAWVFDAGLSDAANELKLGRDARQGSEEFHEHFTVDRTFSRDGVRWIIDFKTSHKPPTMPQDEFVAQQRSDYSQQLQRYGELIRGFDSRPQQLALLLIATNTLVLL